MNGAQRLLTSLEDFLRPQFLCLNMIQNYYFDTYEKIFASPVYEYLDTRRGIEGSALAGQNLLFRIMVRGVYLTITTLMAAALPFIGDFMSLTGAVTTIRLAFCFTHRMCI